MQYLQYIKAFTGLLFFTSGITAQTRVWENINSSYGDLPAGVNVFRTTTPLDGKPNIAYYVEADLDAKHLVFTTDTGRGKRYTPSQFYNRSAQALVVVNGTFFAFEDNRNLNMVVRDGKLLAHNTPSVAGRGVDTMKFFYPLRGAIGITRRRKADVAWVFTDTSKAAPYAIQYHPLKFSGTKVDPELADLKKVTARANVKLKKWRRIETAIAGGPVLVQENKVAIFNEEEMMFAGKAIADKHPRTAMGYTKGGKLIILVIQGRAPGVAEGATLVQEANMLSSLGCYEALNLDGGGSSCMLVNGKETIKPSDTAGQRPVPAVLMILRKPV
jgi:hypothetical protein